MSLPFSLEELKSHLLNAGVECSRLPENFEVLHGGRSRTTYKFYAEETPLVLSVYNKQQPVSPEEGHRYVKFLHAQGCSVPETLGDLGVFSDGKKFKVKEFVNGVNAADTLSGAQATSIGQELAQIHKVSEHYDLELAGNYIGLLAKQSKLDRIIDMLGRTGELVGKTIADIGKEDGLRLQVVAEILADKFRGQLGLNSPDEIRQSVLHKDIHLGNVLFKDNQAVIFDFESIRKGAITEDMASAAYNIAIRHYVGKEGQSPLDKNLLYAFTLGYESVNPLSDSEKEAFAETVEQVARGRILAQPHLVDVHVASLKAIKELREEMHLGNASSAEHVSGRF